MALVSTQQVVLNMGSLLDERLQLLYSSGRSELSLEVTSGAEDEARSAWQTDCLIVQYQQQVRRLTAGAKCFFYGGPDASRVGTKKLHLSMAKVAGNPVWHNPPQVAVHGSQGLLVGTSKAWRLSWKKTVPRGQITLKFGNSVFYEVFSGRRIKTNNVTGGPGAFWNFHQTGPHTTGGARLL